MRVDQRSEERRSDPGRARQQRRAVDSATVELIEDLAREPGRNQNGRHQNRTVEVGAESDGSGQRERPPALMSAPGKEPHDEGQQEQGEEFGSEKEPGSSGEHAERCENKRHRRVEAAGGSDPQEKQHERGHDEHPHDHEKGGAAEVEERGGDDLEKPLVIDPLGPVRSEAEDIVVEDLAVLEHPPTAGEVPADGGVGDLERAADQAEEDRGGNDCRGSTGVSGGFGPGNDGGRWRWRRHG